jgi:glucan biosynthesis protein
MRLAFTLMAPEDVKQVELRAELLREDARVTEIWLNRWMAS